MENKVNEYVVQIMGGRKNLVHIDRPLRLHEDVTLKVECSVEEAIRTDPDHDGRDDIIYKVKGIYCEEL